MKKMRKMMLRAGLAAMALGTAGSASAAQYLFSFGGVVDFSTVTGGTLFGATGNGLNNARFSATITYDDTTPGLFYSYVGSPTQTSAVGYDSSNPTTGTFSINGISYNVPPIGNGTGAGDYSLFNNAPTLGDQIGIGSSSVVTNGTIATDYFSRSVSFSGFLIDRSSLSLTNSINLADLSGFNYTGTGANFHTGNFRVAETSFHNSQLTQNTVAAGSYQIDRFSVERLAGGPGAVPEPATWAMMIFGFGLVGSGMRKTNARYTNKRRPVVLGEAHTV